MKHPQWHTVKSQRCTLRVVLLELMLAHSLLPPQAAVTFTLGEMVSNVVNESRPGVAIQKLAFGDPIYSTYYRIEMSIQPKLLMATRKSVWS
jgi:hypothetical protein